MAVQVVIDCIMLILWYWVDVAESTARGKASRPISKYSASMRSLEADIGRVDRSCTGQFHPHDRRSLGQKSSAHRTDTHKND